MALKKYNKNKHQLSRKHNVSEVVNPKLSLKRESYKNGNKNVNLNKIFKRKKHLKDVQKGGDNFLKSEFQRIKTLDVAEFEVANKQQYNTLRRNIKLTIRLSWINMKLGIITRTQYELMKRLLKLNRYFARMKLENSKMLYVLNKLIADESSQIKTAQRYIRKIFEYQQQIETGYLTLEGKLKMDSREGWFKKLRKNPMRYIKKLIKKQDKLRNKLLAVTAFENTKDLSRGCVAKEKLRDLTFNFDYQKQFICMMGRYRKIEARFNKYYNLFYEQYLKFNRD